MRRMTVLCIVVVAAGLFVWSPWATHDSKPAGHETKEITVLTFGGSFAEAQRKAYFVPYKNEAAVSVRAASYNGEYGKLKGAVESGTIIWDVVDIESSALIRGKAEGLFVPIDYKVVDSSNHIAEAVDEYGIGTDLYSVSLGLNTQRFPDDKTRPENWRDFWNVTKFPGPRCLKRDARFTLEIALMADGVPPDRVYANGELDVDRAFASLDRVKKHVALWWTTGAQPIQALADGEVVMAAAFGARMWLAEHRDKRPVSMTWNQSIIDTEYWAVLKGANDIAASMRFIAFASSPERQAVFSENFPLGPANKRAFEHLDPARARQLNTYPDHLRKHLFFNASWWAKHEKRISERFNSWLSD